MISGAMPGTAHFSWVGARAQLLLSQLSTTGLTTKRQCLEYLGSHFRVVLISPDRYATNAPLYFSRAVCASHTIPYQQSYLPSEEQSAMAAYASFIFIFPWLFSRFPWGFLASVSLGTLKFLTAS